MKWLNSIFGRMNHIVLVSTHAGFSIVFEAALGAEFFFQIKLQD
jgi:hypothetical protein